MSTLKELTVGVVLGAALVLVPAGVVSAVGTDPLADETRDFPVCELEDGSDFAPADLPCVWNNDGKEWLTFENHSEPR